MCLPLFPFYWDDSQNSSLADKRLFCPKSAQKSLEIHKVFLRLLLLDL